MAALGEGRYDSAFGLLGMILGAGLYAEAYPVVKRTVLTWGDFGKLTLPSVLGVNHWIVIVILMVVFISLLYWLERRGL
jgi:hypothetical protein